MTTSRALPPWIPLEGSPSDAVRWQAATILPHHPPYREQPSLGLHMTLHTTSIRSDTRSACATLQWDLLGSRRKRAQCNPSRGSVRSHTAHSEHRVRSTSPRPRRPIQALACAVAGGAAPSAIVANPLLQLVDTCQCSWHPCSHGEPALRGPRLPLHARCRICKFDWGVICT